MAQCQKCRQPRTSLWAFSCGCRCCAACCAESITEKCPKCNASGRHLRWRLVTHEELQFGTDGLFTQCVKRVDDVLCCPATQFATEREHADYEERKVELCCRLMAPAMREAAEAELAEYQRRHLQDILRWRRGEQRTPEPEQKRRSFVHRVHPVLQKWFDAAPVPFEHRKAPLPPRPNLEQWHLMRRRAREEAFGTLGIKSHD